MQSKVLRAHRSQRRVTSPSLCRRMIFSTLSAGFQYRRARERHRHFPPQTSMKTPLPRVDTVSQERWTTQGGNVREYLNSSRIDILSSVDPDSSFEPRKKMSEVMQLQELASTQLHANYQPECKCLYWNAGCSWTWVWAPFQDYSKPHYDSFEREGLYGGSSFLQHFRKWRKLPLHADLNYSFFEGRRNFCMLMPIRMYLRHLGSKTEGHQSVCQVHGPSARCAWDRKRASGICQWL